MRPLYEWADGWGPLEYQSSAIDDFTESSPIAKVGMGGVLFVILSFIKHLFRHIIFALLFGHVASLIFGFFLGPDDTTTHFVGWCVVSLSFFASMKSAGVTAAELLDEP